MIRYLITSYILAAGIFYSCGNASKALNDVDNSAVVATTDHDNNSQSEIESEEKEPDIELATFEKVIAEKRTTSTTTPETKRVVSKPKKKPSAKKKKYAQITFDSVIHHLPDITEGDTFKDVFRFTNTSEVPLSISFATASCGCTLPSYPFLDIPPDSSDVIRVDYNSVGKEGPQEALITVTANTYPKEFVLKMVFNVNEKEKVEEDRLMKDSLPD